MYTRLEGTTAARDGRGWINRPVDGKIPISSHLSRLLSHDGILADRSRGMTIPFKAEKKILP